MSHSDLLAHQTSCQD
ncbi:hypothetical protein LINPERPRIM_LOCUS35867 [Linum perenne]